ncbi:MAG: hypothetical protein ACI4O3_03280 [Oscillospiraceae bacterium]
MLGRIRWSAERKIQLENERLLDLPLLTLFLPERTRSQEKRVKKGSRLLIEQRVTRVLTPPDFPFWPLLMEQGLRPVDTRTLRCALAPVWVKAALAARGIRPQNAVLLLTGTRESADMAQVAWQLCPLVRNLVIDVPGGGTLAAGLRREYGLPVLPARSAQADLILRFDAGPVLAGARFDLAGAALPADCETLPLLSALWESGRIRTEEIVVQI